MKYIAGVEVKIKVWKSKEEREERKGERARYDCSPTRSRARMCLLGFHLLSNCTAALGQKVVLIINKVITNTRRYRHVSWRCQPPLLVTPRRRARWDVRKTHCHTFIVFSQRPPTPRPLARVPHGLPASPVYLFLLGFFKRHNVPALILHFHSKIIHAASARPFPSPNFDLSHDLFSGVLRLLSTLLTLVLPQPKVLTFQVFGIVFSRPLDGFLLFRL